MSEAPRQDRDDWKDGWSDPDAFANAPWPPPLTREEARQLVGERAGAGGWLSPLRLVGLQLVVAVVCAAAWWALTKADPVRAAVSALLAGVVVVVPSLLFALRLLAMRSRPTVAGLVVGEALKIFLTIALFLAVIVGYRDVHWAPLLVTYVLVLKTSWIAAAIR